MSTEIVFNGVFKMLGKLESPRDIFHGLFRLGFVCENVRARYIYIKNGAAKYYIDMANPSVTKYVDISVYRAGIDDVLQIINHSNMPMFDSQVCKYDVDLSNYLQYYLNSREDINETKDIEIHMRMVVPRFDELQYIKN